jgi:hypothetical protein
MTTLTAVWGNRQRLVRAVSIGAILVLALYWGLIAPMNQPWSGASSKTTGMGVATSDYSEQRAAGPRNHQILAYSGSGVIGGVIGGIPGGVPDVKSSGIKRQSSDDERKVIRTGSLLLIVLHPAEAVDRVTQIAQRHGGYVIQSQVSGQREYETGSVTLRVPAAQFDAVRQELKGLAKSVEQETTSADDVTMSYAGNEATLRNYRAEEASYIEIMKRSGKIKDTLAVAEQLSDVRGRIERLAAEIRTMNLQSDMTAITVSLRTEPVVMAGNGWRPLYQLRLAWKEGLDALADYATSMMAFLLRLPAVAAWAFTLLVGLKLGWWLLRKFGSVLGLWKPTPVVQ